MSQVSGATQTQYFEVLSIPDTPPHLKRQGYTKRSICFSIVEIPNDVDARIHKIKQLDVKCSIKAITFDRKLSNVWIFFHQLAAGILPLCIRMGHQIQNVPRWVSKNGEKGPFENITIYEASPKHGIFDVDISSDGNQAVLEFKHKTNREDKAVKISFLDGKYESEVHPSPELPMPTSNEEAAQFGVYPIIYPGYDRGEIMDDGIIPAKGLEKLAKAKKLRPWAHRSGDGKWWGFLRLLDFDRFCHPIFVHPIPAAIAEGQLKQIETENLIRDEKFRSNEEE